MTNSSPRMKIARRKDGIRAGAAQRKLPVYERVMIRFVFLVGNRYKRSCKLECFFCRSLGFVF